FFFFFQAEDGIRDFHVTGVQTCALPISIHAARARHDELQALREEAESLTEALAARKVIERAKGLLMEKENLSEDEAFTRLRKARSEERRVGKEGRSGGGGERGKREEGRA